MGLVVDTARQVFDEMYAGYTGLDRREMFGDEEIREDPENGDVIRHPDRYR